MAELAYVLIKGRDVEDVDELTDVRFVGVYETVTSAVASILWDVADLNECLGDEEGTQLVCLRRKWAHRINAKYIPVQKIRKIEDVYEVGDGLYYFVISTLMYN